MSTAMRFLWDPRKAASNQRKHGVGFQEATTVFDDSLSVTVPDPTTPWPRSAFCCLACRIVGGCSSWPIPSRASRSESSARGEQIAGREESMKKKRARQRADRDTMRPHYDFRGGVRGKYVSRYRAGTNVVVLDPDVAAVFSSALAVNRALRTLLEVVPPRPARRRSA
jgi:hypothetical protein